MKYKCILGLLALAGCASPNPDYYTLYPLPGPDAAASTTAMHLTVKIQRPGLASLLDRPEMVAMRGTSEVGRDTVHLWAEPLDKMAERVLALDLGKRLPASSIITESGSMQSDFTYHVEWELQRFGADGDGRAVLAAQLLIAAPGERAMPEPVVLQGAKTGSGKALADALSQLLARLSDKITADIQAKQMTALAVSVTPGGLTNAPLSLLPALTSLPVPYQ